MVRYGEKNEGCDGDCAVDNVDGFGGCSGWHGQRRRMRRWKGEEEMVGDRRECCGIIVVEEAERLTTKDCGAWTGRCRDGAHVTKLIFGEILAFEMII
jgi:hypothetical protein